MYSRLPEEKEESIDLKLKRIMLSLREEETGKSTEYVPPVDAFNPVKGTKHIKPFWSPGRF